MAEKKHILVLGGGMVGSVIAADLSEDNDFSVSLADIDLASFEKGAKKERAKHLNLIQADLSQEKEILKLAEKADFVVGALPSRFGFLALKTMIKAKRSYCDISFMSEDPRSLDDEAEKAGITIFYDFGVAPGMSNLLAAYAEKEVDECDEVKIYVGGLPKERHWPFQYKAGFAPYDVIEEYTRSSRIIRDGKMIEKEALSDPELIRFDHVGDLEAFNTDGLRSLADTLNCPNRIEKTLRYPGHIELMRVLRHIGLFSEEAIKVGGHDVIPREVMAKLLFPLWTFEENEADLTVMRIEARSETGRSVRFELHDEFDPKMKRTSMSRTTGYPAAILSRMIAKGELDRPGVHPPEALAEKKYVDRLFDELANRGVIYRRFDS